MAKNLVEKSDATVTESQGSHNRGPVAKMSFLKGPERLPQYMLRLAQASSGSAQACSPSAQVKAAAAQVQRRKRKFCEVGCHG